jgi:hypothetical protein
VCVEGGREGGRGEGEREREEMDVKRTYQLTIKRSMSIIKWIMYVFRRLRRLLTSNF